MSVPCALNDLSQGPLIRYIVLSVNTLVHSGYFMRMAYIPLCVPQWVNPVVYCLSLRFILLCCFGEPSCLIPLQGSLCASKQPCFSSVPWPRRICCLKNRVAFSYYYFLSTLKHTLKKLNGIHTVKILRKIEDCFHTGNDKEGKSLAVSLGKCWFLPNKAPVCGPSTQHGPSGLHC